MKIFDDFGVFSGLKMTKPFSVQKRQIHISEAFKKMQNKPRTLGGNLDENSIVMLYWIKVEYQL